jgi:hypothetical protein
MEDLTEEREQLLPQLAGAHPPSGTPTPNRRTAPGPTVAGSVHEDDLCHWYYDVGVVCAPDSQDFVTFTTDRAVFDALDAAGRACPACVAMLHA